MEILRVNGGRRLSGDTRLTAAKNAALPIMAAALMIGETVTLPDIPHMADIETMGNILRTLGCHVDRQDRTLMINASAASRAALEGELPTRLRSSIFALGPLLGRFRQAEAVYPGGCAIGKRPIDLHLKGLAAFGARVKEEGNTVRIDGRGMHAADVRLAFPSVGATENLMMAAVLLPGESRIIGAAREPEIVDLAGFLNAMGAKIQGAGESVIAIEGVKSLHGGEYRPIPDRIVAGTLLAAGAITGGSVEIANAVPEHLGAVTAVLRRMGTRITEGKRGVRLTAALPLQPAAIATASFPGFPTDMQAPLMALACRAQGESRITETMFENRFQHVEMLRRMGADICLSHRTAIIRGGKLYGAAMEARDLRCGAALVLAALAAEGESVIAGVPLIDRGYERLEAQLNALGAEIRRETC